MDTVEDNTQNQNITDEDNDKDEVISKLIKENKKMQDEFNVQRARLKELFLQKEADCNNLSVKIDNMKQELSDIRSQNLFDEMNRDTEFQRQDRRAQEEIDSMQQLVHETIEESIHSKSEIERLSNELKKIKDENLHLRTEISQQQDSTSLVPVMSQVRKTIVRKLGGDTGNIDMEESKRKAQEDADVLRSLVVPLEEEIKALKEKIRTTDQELQTYRSHKPNDESALVGLLKEQQQQQHQHTSPNPTTDDSGINITDIPNTIITLSSVEPVQQQQPCTVCKSIQLKLSQCEIDLAEQVTLNITLKKDIERSKEQLERENVLRCDLEEQWQDKREAHKREVLSLSEKVQLAETHLNTLQLNYDEARLEIKDQLIKLSNDREQIQRHLETLQSDNDFLAGKYLETSEELQNERIDLPDNVEDLQESMLNCHESLIKARIGLESEQRKLVSCNDEIELLRLQLQQQYSIKEEYDQKEKELKSKIKKLIDELHHFKAQKDIFNQKEIEFQKQSTELHTQVIQLRESNEKFERLNTDLKQKMNDLQHNLDRQESVQKDFVRLSQSLQVELEKIRGADTSVRWQDDEDVDQCPICKSQFTVTRRKTHCRHCGTIYCDNCLTKSVPAGQKKKPAKVCDVCHTLLERNTAPYFSQAPPQSPT